MKTTPNQNGEKTAEEVRNDLKDKRMKMEDKMTQLRSLATVISGEGFANLQSYNDEIQNNVLWLVADLAAEIQDLYQETYRGFRV